jgi:hypothetical protein
MAVSAINCLVISLPHCHRGSYSTGSGWIQSKIQFQNDNGTMKRGITAWQQFGKLYC